MSTLFYVSEIQLDRTAPQQGLGIAVYAEENGTLTLKQRFITDCIGNVSCLDRERGILYVTAEEADPAVRREMGDRILVLKLDGETGLISEKLGEAHVLSPNTVYVALDPTRRYLVAANHALHTMVYKVEKGADGEWRSRGVYDDSTVVLLSLNDDGTVRRVEDVAFQEGSGPLRTQTHAHPHCAVFAPSGRFFAVCDKGADKVFLYEIDREANRLRLFAEPYAALPGDEPRFCAFHPTLPILYVNHEGNTSLDVLRYTESGALTHLQTIDADPDPAHRRPGAVYEHQGIAVEPGGRALYSVVRGVNALAVYAVDPETGLLTLAQLMDMGAGWPRCCEISQDGKWVAAGDRNSGSLFLYRVEDNGLLTESDCVQHQEGVAYVLPVNRP